MAISKKSKKLTKPAKLGRPRICFTYEEARTIVQSEGITSKEDYSKWWKYNTPSRMPKRPDRAYARSRFSWADFLGIKNKFPCRGIKYRSYEDAKKFVSTLGLKNKTEWILYAKSPAKPIDIPSRPDLKYAKTLEWISWKIFLGVGLNRKFENLIEASREIFYIVRLPNRPANVFKFGSTFDSIDSLIQLQNKGALSIVRVYYLHSSNEDWLSLVETMGKPYAFGSENEYSVFNIAEVISHFSTYYSVINL